MFNVLNSHIAVMRRTESSIMHTEEKRFIHALLGIVSEYFELKDWVYEKKGKANLIEELGDLIWYISLGVDSMNLPFESLNPFILTPTLIDTLKEHEDNFAIKAAIKNEIGKMSDMIKAMIFYNRPYSVQDKLKMLACALNAVLILSIKHDIAIEQICKKNFEKLKTRYPNKYSDIDANNRDIEAEQKVLENNLYQIEINSSLLLEKRTI
jgi:NTP pyrophosphatase (non-canonical NTP hydrolase)